MYALALVPLVQRLLPYCKQVWYADDATGCDEFVKMRKWFDELQRLGPCMAIIRSPPNASS